MLRASSCRLELGFRQDRSREFGLEPAVLEVTVLSADDLKEVNMFWKMEVYAVVSISSDPRSAQKTPVDREGGRNPRWEHPMKFTVDVVAPWAVHDVALVFKLRAKSSLGDTDIGEVHVPIRDLMDDQARAPVPRVEGKRPGRVVMYTVCTSSGRSKGHLEFAYKFIYDNATTSAKPMFKKNLSYGNVFDAMTGCPSPRPENSNGQTVSHPPFDYHPTRCLSLGSSHPQARPGPFLGRDNSFHGPPIGYGYNLPQPQPYQGLSYGYPIYPPQQHHWHPAGHGHGYGHPPVQLSEPPQSRDKKGREDQMPPQNTEKKDKKGKKGKWLGLWIASGFAGGFLGGPKTAKMVKEVTENVARAPDELPALKDKTQAGSNRLSS